MKIRKTAQTGAFQKVWACDTNRKMPPLGASATDNEVSKESYIRLLQHKGRKVAMVGDAANDLTAIACADVGIAVKSSIGDTLTEEHAGMVVQQDLLFPIATAFDVASKTKQNIFQNLFVSLTYNSMITLIAAGLFLSLGFALNPVIGVALMVVESAIVLANLYRLKHQETVTIASNQGDQFDSDHTEETTSQILSGLDFSPKSSLDKHNDRVIDSDPVPYEQKIIQPGKAYGFFEPMRTAANDMSIVLEPSTAASFK